MLYFKKQQIPFLLSLIFIFLASGYIIVSAWIEPTALPPGGNVDPPIHRGTADQTKIGGLTTSILSATRFIDSNDSAYYIDPNGSAGLSAYFGGTVGIGWLPTTDNALTVRLNGAGKQNLLRLVNSQAAAANVGGRIMLQGNGADSMVYLDAGWEGAANTNAYFSVYTRGSGAIAEKFRITSAGNVGIGVSPDAGNKLQVAGKIQASGGDVCTDQGGGVCLSTVTGGLPAVAEDALLVGNTVAGAWEAKDLPTCDINLQKLHYNPVGNTFSCASDQSGGTGSVNGSGTIGRIPKWTAGTTLGNSIISESGSMVSINGDLTVAGANLYIGSANNQINDLAGALEIYSDDAGDDYIELQSNDSTYGIIIREDVTNGGTEWGNVEVRNGVMYMGFNNAAGPLSFTDDDCLRIDTAGGTCSQAESLVVDGRLQSAGISTYDTTVSAGTIEAAEFCLGNGETECVSGTWPTGGGGVIKSGSPNSSYVAYWSGTDTITGEAGFTYNAAGNWLSVYNLEASKIQVNDSLYIERKTSSYPYDARIFPENSMTRAGLTLGYRDDTGWPYRGLTIDQNGNVLIGVALNNPVQLDPPASPAGTDRLRVEGGPIHAVDGLIIQQISNSAITPEPTAQGSIWMCTDTNNYNCDG